MVHLESLIAPVKINRGFVLDQAMAAATSFFAPAVGLISGLRIAAMPRINTRKAVARLRHGERLAIHPRRLAILSAIDDGMNLDQLIAELTILAKEEHLNGHIGQVPESRVARKRRRHSVRNKRATSG